MMYNESISEHWTVESFNLNRQLLPLIIHYNGYTNSTTCMVGLLIIHALVYSYQTNNVSPIVNASRSYSQIQHHNITEHCAMSLTGVQQRARSHFFKIALALVMHPEL